VIPAIFHHQAPPGTLLANLTPRVKLGHLSSAILIESSPVLASLSAADRVPRGWLFIMKSTTRLSVFPSQPVFRIVCIIHKGGAPQMCGYGSLIMKHYEPGSSSFWVSAGHYRRLLHILTGTQLILPPASRFVAVVPVCTYILQPNMPVSSYYTVLLPVYRTPNRLQPFVRLFSSWA
jgi:hypothetical protein